MNGEILRPIRFGSVCSGIEAASVAWEKFGWQPAWFSEIEDFPCDVLKYHWPDVPNLGDMLNLPQDMRAGFMEAPDVLVGGTPCQSFSMAGRRLGLSDDRGQLTLAYVDLLDEIDRVRLSEGKDSCIAVWENVPGVLTSDDNAFGCFVSALGGGLEPITPGPRPDRGRSSTHWTWKKKTSEHHPRWSDAGYVVGPARTVAWRILNAEYFGLAQRRRRVIVVASARKGFDPAEILFEFEGLRRDSPPCREARESVTHAVAPCLTSSGRGVDRAGDSRGQDAVVAVHRGPAQLEPTWWNGDQVSQTLDAVLSKGQTMPEKNRFPAVLQPVPVCVHGTQHPIVAEDYAHTLGRNNGAENAVCMTGEVTHTLKADGFDGSEDGTGRGQPIIAFKPGQSEAAGAFFATEEYAPTLQAQNNGSTAVPAVQNGMAVRRLMPVECERLQGFPDGHTNVKRKGKEPADGPRYKSIGNSMATTCMEWVGRRIDAVIGVRA